MALGDKEYNYNYYGLPVSREWKNNDDITPFAALVKPNIWSYWPDGIYYDDGQYANTDKNGKPLDDTIAVWRLPRNASFACNAFFSVDISSTLSAHYDVNVENNDVPLLCAAIDTTSTNWGKFDRKCVERYAYDTVNACNGPKSALAYDVNPTALCLRGAATIYDRATPAAVPAGRDVAQIAAYIDASPSTRDLTVIRPYMYRGTGATRIYTAETIPEFNAPYFDGVLLADTSSNIPIPEGQTYLKSLIADTAGGHDYRNDVIYRPFVTRLNNNLYSGTNDGVYTSQLEIGFTRPFTRNQITAGAATISGVNKISAQIYRCNYDIKSFDDVVYQWENVIFDTVNGVELNNGFDLSALGNNSIRFYTRLRIIDDKGNSKGKALELAVKHELAYIGFYFADTQVGAESAVLGSTGDGVGVYLPEKIGGVTTGRYFTGDEIKNVPYADADSAAAFPYEPEMSGSDSGDLDTHLHSDSLNSGVQWFALTDGEIYLLSQWLNTSYKPDSTQLSEDFKGVNPSDYIVSIRYYPFDVPAGSGTNLTIGGIPVVASGVQVVADTHFREYGEGSNSFYDLGSFALQPPYIYGDFRDTYIKLLLYIPWCGFVTLDPALFCQSPDGTYHSIRVTLSIDFATGTALGMIYRDNRLIDTINGTVGVDVPMSAVANGSYQNAIKQTEIALKNAKAQQLQAYLSTAGALAGGIVSAATGNVMGVAASAAAFAGAAGKTEQLNNTIEGLEYQLTHTAPSIGDISSASPFNNALSEQAARIFIFKPVMLPTYDAAAYGRTTGYACCKQGTLSQFTGFTVCADVDLSGFDAPAHHKAAIKQALQKGVYL